MIYDHVMSGQNFWHNFWDHLRSPTLPTPQKVFANCRVSTVRSLLPMAIHKEIHHITEMGSSPCPCILAALLRWPWWPDLHRSPPTY